MSEYFVGYALILVWSQSPSSSNDLFQPKKDWQLFPEGAGPTWKTLMTNLEPFIKIFRLMSHPNHFLIPRDQFIPFYRHFFYLETAILICFSLALEKMETQWHNYF